MLNQVVLIGRMGNDPELKYTPSGIAVASFRLAVNRNFKSQSGEQETDWIDIVTWRQSAEFAANYLGKGRLVAVEGRLQTRNWVAQDGSKRKAVEVVANRVVGLDRPKEQATAG
ncbi:MAG TPA: single-stranded DNA-binding protein, partial [Armatimonadota bacterium]|nr:single-stranded DNA-binding protein [Armatimonadota bacterium]